MKHVLVLVFQVRIGHKLNFFIEFSHLVLIFKSNIGFRVQSALNPSFEIEHSLDLEHFKPSTDQVP